MIKKRWKLLLFLLCVVCYAASWHLLPTRDLPVLVVDKTVPEPDYREHRAFFWLLEHYRFTSQGRFLKAEEDYLGYHPDDNGGEVKKETLHQEDLEGIILLYLVDTYGVYHYEEGYEQYEKRLPHEYEPVSLIYGGLSSEEVNAVSSFSQDERAFLLGEFNIFGFPTYRDPEASLELQELFGVRHTGWTGQYYARLDQVAYHFKELYERIYGRTWDFQGEGIVFVRDDLPSWEWYPDIVVLTSSDLSAPYPLIQTVDHPLTSGASREDVPYTYWIEVLEAGPGAEVLASFTLPVNEAGAAKLEARDVPDTFPAMVYHHPAGTAKRVYFAGDFVDMPYDLWGARLTGMAGAMRVFSYLPGVPEEYRFFWRWYAPVIKNILESAKTG